MKYVFRFIASCLGIFIRWLSAGIDNMNRVVVVSAFYETKRTADEQVSFTKNDQQVTANCLARTAIKSQYNFQFIHSLFNTYVVLLISDIDIKGSD